ncbi:SWIM zinc finger family protein [Knoellia sp. p5-6-4]|uniref:SWIM zinc finger family protein n=1 Tax=unclassified Knoellia TaxID=2618719 RepID=UPI0023DBFECF|nr:SWIM zinc finger family protein [Knoellia sp. p5-6-4]MDF2144693.1 SWIM zinc finger domain-containing protein [Knoellia sp. p5-6-4]
MTSAGYRGASVMSPTADGSLLALETALGLTPTGPVERPHFFTGLLARPDVAAAGLLAVADVAASRYFDAGLMRRLANLDPVVTASGDRLRFESFSACNGVHARLDLLGDGIASGEVGFGTTNVDVNQPLRTALASVGREALVHLSVGADELRVSTPEASHEERKVAMPDRWVRGFAEVPVLASGLAHAASLTGSAVVRFLAGLPKRQPGPSLYLVPGPAGLRQSARPVPGAVHLAGAGRLAAAARIARFATSLDAFSSDSGASGWVLHLPGARLTLLLSPEPHRGFSGEGGLLRALSADAAEGAAAQLLEFLAWEPVVDPIALAELTGLPPEGVHAGLAVLATSGKVGFDVVEQSWFHRELPLAERVERDNPRLVAARRLVSDGAVGRDGDRWVVTVDDHQHWVRGVGEAASCTCLWHAKHRGGRGPCKHVLAVAITAADPVG